MATWWSNVTRLPLNLGFFTKITVHIVLITLLTGLAITLGTTYQFRREIHRVEQSTISLIFNYTVDYLEAHYRSHQGYVRRNIDYSLRQRLRMQTEDVGFSADYVPSHLVLYDARGQVVYEYRVDDLVPVAASVLPEDLPDRFTFLDASIEGDIRAVGPVRAGSPELGYLMMQIPNTIQAQTNQLLIKALVIMTAVLLVTIVLSLFFTRQALAPVRALTTAVRSVHRGDPYRRVPVTADDEVGELTQTFNDLTESMEHRMDFMHRMQEWTVRIGRQLDTTRLFELLGEMFERMSTADAYRLYLQNDKTGELEIRLEYGAQDWPPPEEDTLARMALQERWTMYLKSGGIPDNEPTDVLELAIPLLSGKHRVGVIRIGRKTDRSLYDDDTLTILQTLAQQASVAIDNANLYERLAAQERMAQEMTLARQIQNAMLPDHPPEIEGYQVVGGSLPALEVGGDYFDYLQRGDRCYFLIADVSGKGVPAAMIMSISRAMIHTYLEFESAPATVLRRVNQSISNDLDPEMFVTMTMLQLDAASHRLHLSRAGHEPLLVIHANGQHQRLSPGGSALGMMMPEDFDRLLEENQIDLAPGDIILLYTDGITEAQNRQQEEFGYDRLEELACELRHESAAIIYERILDAVQHFSDGLAQLDDITLLVLKRDEAGDA